MARWPVPRLPQPPGPVSDPGPGPDAAPAAGPQPFDRRVIWVGGVVFAVLMALSPRYGFHRDELYFLDGARHLQASYVDQPVLTPLLAWVSVKLFGISLPGLRLWPALAAGATVVISGLTARELGGGRRAQLLAAIGTGTMPALLAIGHLADTTPYDVLAWTALALVVVRIGRTGDCRWWLAAGLILGLGLANKHSAGLFAAALVAGALLSGGRAMVLNRWFLAGAAIAVAFTVPDLWWQAQHQWATIAMTQALNQANGGLGNAGTWVIGQVIMVTLALVWVWLAGLRFLWRSGRPLWRALAWAYGLLFVLFAVTTGAKIYYLAGTYPYLLAAGFVAVDGWLAARRGPGPQPAAGHRADDRGGAADRAARPAGRGRRLDLHRQRGQRRVHRLAPAGPDRTEGLAVPVHRTQIPLGPAVAADAPLQLTTARDGCMPALRGADYKWRDAGRVMRLELDDARRSARAGCRLCHASVRLRASACLPTRRPARSPNGA